MFFRKPTNDVTAVVLTIGEPTTQEAIDSVRRQTAAVSDIIVVRDTRPFHKALNAGAERVATPFFVQVDADMVLDCHCIATLRKAMAPNVGMTVGHLRDGIMQQVVGIKLFRTECFAIAQLRNSISPDTDFVDEIARAGWQTVYVGRRRGAGTNPWKTLGEHKPDYSAEYTYRKYLMEGRRYRHRCSVGGLRSHFERLEQSRHPSAFVAQIALARGFFCELDFDGLGSLRCDEEFARLESFLRIQPVLRAGSAADGASEERSLHNRFRACFRIGYAAFNAKDPDAFRCWMTRLSSHAGDRTAWISKLALCQGLLATASNDHAIEADFGRLSDFLSAAKQGLNVSLPTASDAADASAQNALQLDDVMAYATSVGLRRFVVAPPAGAQYAMSAGSDSYHRTAADVVGVTDAKGRPRIKVPLQPFGHIVCTEPERTARLLWCLDLLKAGYMFAHVPTALGAYRVRLPRLLARNILERCGWRPSSTQPSQLHAAAISRMARSRRPSYQPKSGCVLMVAENLGRGGSERQMVAMVLALRRRGYDVKVFSLARLEPGVPSFEEELARLGIIPEYAPDPVWIERASMRRALDRVAPADCSARPGWLARIVAIAAAIERHQAAVVHGWLDGPGVFSALAGCILGTPRSVIQQGSMATVRRGFRSSDLFRQAYRALARNPAVKILNNSEAGARDNETWLGLRPGTVAVLYNGFLPESARAPGPEETARFRASLGLAADAAVVGTVMRFVPEKDPALWLDTAAEVAKTRPDVRFLIGGFGPLEHAIRARIEALGLSSRVVLAGPVEDVGLVYSAMDIVLLSSAIEGIPNVMIEAQAVGRRVVAPDVGGTREAVLDGRTGVIVRPRSAESLAKAVIAMLHDMDGKERICTEGPDFVAGRFGLERMVGETLGHYGSELFG
jgi:glycosyltransferase involved in cell wall biosynthesis